MTSLLIALVSTASTAALLWTALRYASPAWLPDHANHRSLHTGVIPRFGGIAILVGLLVSLVAGQWAGLPTHYPLPAQWWAPAGLVFGLALLDDWRALPWYWRFPVQSFAALWFALLLVPMPHWALLCLAVLTLQWSTNLFNFMDGMDGLAGTMAAVGFSAFWLAGGGHFGLAILIAASCLGFLLFNRHPAKVFMGDSGSTTLGMLAAGIGVAGVHNGLWKWPLPVLVFLPFVYDSSSTLVLRLLAGKRVWEAHREHMYQRAVLAGYRVPTVWAISATLMAICSGVALAIQDRPLHDQIFALACCTALFGALQLLLFRTARLRHPSSERQH
jgi:UDP-GlcNAc:undecaprenyl-phosphate/decaprenyl-phosphate GlcNAc-1-phosphate transferase